MSTHIKISTITVGAGGAASIDFTSIPATYTDLLIKYSLRQTGAGGADTVYLNFNSTGTTGSHRRLRGDGSTATSYNSTTTIGGLSQDAGYTANTFASGEIYIPNYASANYKSASIDAVTENNAAGALAELQAILWSNTSAITSITITNASSVNFVQYSSATLYGIKSS